MKLDQLEKQLDAPKPLYNKHLPKEVDLNVLIRRVEELNYLILKDGGEEIIKDKNGVID